MSNNPEDRIPFSSVGSAKNEYLRAQGNLILVHPGSSSDRADPPLFRFEVPALAPLSLTTTNPLECIDFNAGITLRGLWQSGAIVPYSILEGPRGDTAIYTLHYWHKAHSNPDQPTSVETRPHLEKSYSRPRALI